MGISTYTKQFGDYNYQSNLMGIPAHDYLVNVYDASNNLLFTTYKLAGEVVGIVTMTYDGNNNLLTAERKL